MAEDPRLTPPPANSAAPFTGARVGRPSPGMSRAVGVIGAGLVLFVLLVVLVSHLR